MQGGQVHSLSLLTPRRDKNARPDPGRSLLSIHSEDDRGPGQDIRLCSRGGATWGHGLSEAGLLEHISRRMSSRYPIPVSVNSDSSTFEVVERGAAKCIWLCADVRDAQSVGSRGWWRMVSAHACRPPAYVVLVLLKSYTGTMLHPLAAG
eukprot:364203-Chlamydomonas_euryale.AAC.5